MKWAIACILSDLLGIISFIGIIVCLKFSVPHYVTAIPFTLCCLFIFLAGFCAYKNKGGDRLW